MFCRRCGSQIPEKLGMCSVCGLETGAPWPPAAATNQPTAAAPALSAAAPPVHAVATPVGVGGWLLFFCISFTILWPLWNLSQYARFHFAFRGLGWFSPIRLALGIMVGVLLWAKSPSAMVLLRVYFGLSVLLTLWAFINWVHVFSRADSVVYSMPMMSFVRSFVIPVIFLAAGILYFSQSERVRATYGGKLF